MYFLKPKMWKSILVSLLFVCLFLPVLGFAIEEGARYIPIDQVISPDLARVQPKVFNRTELSELEKEELKKYGRTGLELITYWNRIQEPGNRQMDGYARAYIVNRRGAMKIKDLLWIRQFQYKSDADLITYNGIKPGDVKEKLWGILINPPYIRGTSTLALEYLQSPTVRKENDVWVWVNSLRRVRRMSAADKEDGVLGLDITLDDFGNRGEFEETHRILGEDTIRGNECFVVESKSIFPDYFLTKRVSLDRQEVICVAP